jgi:hypothetical protein
MEWQVRSVVLDLEFGWPEENAVCGGKKLNNQTEIPTSSYGSGPNRTGVPCILVQVWTMNFWTMEPV